MRIFIHGGPYKNAIGCHGSVISPGEIRRGYWVQYSYWPEDFGELPVIGSDGMAYPRQCLHYFDKSFLRFCE